GCIEIPSIGQPEKGEIRVKHVAQRTLQGAVRRWCDHKSKTVPCDEYRHRRVDKAFLPFSRNVASSHRVDPNLMMPAYRDRRATLSAIAKRRDHFEDARSCSLRTKAPATLE